MRRYHAEKHIIKRRIKIAQEMIGHVFGEWSDPVFKPGRYRKTHTGGNKAACQLCHPEKNPKRIPTRQELQSQKDFQNNVEDS